MTNKKSIGTKNSTTKGKTTVTIVNKSIPNPSVFPVDGTATEKEQTNPVATDATDATAQDKENTEMNTTNTATNTTGTTNTEKPKRKGGGLSKEQRQAKAKEMSEIRARLVSDFTSKFKAGEIPPGEFAQAMLDMEEKVETEYRKAHPKVSTKKGDPVWRAKQTARILIGHFQKKYPDVTKEDMVAFFTAAFDAPIVRERPDLKGKSPNQKKEKTAS